MKKNFFNMGLRYHLMKSKDTGREKKTPSFFLINGQIKKKKRNTRQSPCFLANLNLLLSVLNVHILYTIDQCPQCSSCG